MFFGWPITSNIVPDELLPETDSMPNETTTEMADADVALNEAPKLQDESTPTASAVPLNEVDGPEVDRSWIYYPPRKDEETPSEPGTLYTSSTPASPSLPRFRRGVLETFQTARRDGARSTKMESLGSCRAARDGKLPPTWTMPESQGVVEEEIGARRTVSNSPEGCYFTREWAELEEIKMKKELQLSPSKSYKFRTGAVYTGEWLNNERHGFGTQVWKDGAKFTGYWAQNFAEGAGKFQHANGDVFVGNWKSNAAHGVGQYVHAHRGITISGEWQEDLQHGYGVEMWQGGARFEGQFHYGQKSGFGIYHWPDGSTYAGQWRNNSITGYGRYDGEDGRHFKGMWKNAQIHGLGEYKWPNGRSFSGQYVDDQKEGFGIFIWSDGKHFHGYWKAGKQHGHGVMYAEDGSVLKSGMWKDGNAPGDS
eukprot:symbB.v1.2.020145.t1/scaffold1642.1/size107908/4